MERNVVRACAPVRLDGCRDVLVREAEALAPRPSGAVPCPVASGASGAVRRGAAEDVLRVLPLRVAGAGILVDPALVCLVRACFPWVESAVLVAALRDAVPAAEQAGWAPGIRAADRFAA